MEVALFLTCRQLKDLRREAEGKRVHMLRQEITQTSVSGGEPARTHHKFSSILIYSPVSQLQTFCQSGVAPFHLVEKWQRFEGT
jgi:hypothetical protein